MNILFCGDCVIKNDIKCTKELSDYIRKHDHAVINLEGALAGEEDCPIEKRGPHVRNTPEALRILKEIGFDAFAMANNHIMDYGITALKRSIESCKKNEVEYTGVGTFDTCYVPLRYENVSIINAGETEFGGLKDTSDRFGYALITNRNVVKAIKEEKEKGRTVVIFAHAGLENEITTIPEWRETYRGFIDNGADIVIATHPHIIQGKEIYKGKNVYYSLGNFFFPSDGREEDRDWNQSLMVSLDTDTLDVKERYVEFNESGVRFVSGDETMHRFAERSDLLDDELRYSKYVDEMLEKRWTGFYRAYYSYLSPYSSENLKGLIKRLLQILLRRVDVQFDETMLLHNIQSETHRWCVERYLRRNNMKTNGFLSA